MSNSIGDISSGLVGVSHTTGNEYQAMPSKSAIKPAGSTITVHTEKVLAANDSTDKLKKFIRGDRLQSYTPQENREIRESLQELLESRMKNQETDDLPAEELAHLQRMDNRLFMDTSLEKQVVTARNILIPA